jgi:hypothetical protein
MAASNFVVKNNLEILGGAIVHDGGTLTLPTTTGNLAVVNGVPTAGDSLLWNGSEFVPGRSTAAAGAATVMYLDETIAVGDNFTLSYAPSGAPLDTDTVSVDADVDGGITFIERYVTAPLGKPGIPAGVWEFHTYGYVDSVGGGASCNIVTRINQRRSFSGMTCTFTGAGPTRTLTVTGGTPFVAGDATASILTASLIETPTQTAWISGFTSSSEVTVTLTDPGFVNVSDVPFSAMYYLMFSDTSELLNTTANKPDRYYFSNNAQTAFDTPTGGDKWKAWSPDDSIVAAYFAQNSSSSARNVSLLHGGTDYFTHIVTPLGGTTEDLTVDGDLSVYIKDSNSDANIRGIVAHNYNSTPFSQAKFIGSRARGTRQSPSVVQSGDALVSFNGRGFKSTAWSSTVGGFYVYAAENWTDSVTGTYIALRGVPTGGTTVEQWAKLDQVGLTLNTKGAITVPVGNDTTERPGSPAVGMIRYNNVSNAFEGYSGASPSWAAIGGGSSDVVHTLTTLPGYGVVPDVTVADYAALDAYGGDNVWIEVTVGDSSGVELFRKETVLYGPFGPWIKNAKYFLGQNNETVLIVDIDQTPLVHPSYSSKYTAPTGTLSTADEWAQIRTATCVPIHLNASEFDDNASKKVVNASANAGDFLIVVDCALGAQGLGRNRVLSALSINQTGVAVPGAMGGANFILKAAGEVHLDLSEYSGIGGVPSRWVDSGTDYNRYLSTWASSTQRGILEWDYEDFVLGKLKDVSTATPNDNDVLQYNAGQSQWQPVAIASGLTLADVAGSTTYYPTFSSAATGSISTGYTDATDVYYTSGDNTFYATNFNSASDVRLKDNIETIFNATYAVKQLRGVSFNWKASGNKCYGLVAQEVEELMPELVNTVNDQKSVNYIALIGFLVEAVKEMSARIDELEAKNGL